MFRNNPVWFVVSVLLIAAFGVGLVILLVWYLQCKSTLLELTGQDVILEQGLLSKARTEINVNSIRTVKVFQSFFNRIFGVGKIEIYTAGDNPEISVAGMPDPNRLRDLLNAQQANSTAT